MGAPADPYWRAGAPERRTLARARPVAFSIDRRRLTVGLVNNMPDAALAATERQFRLLLETAAPERRLELQLFHIPEIARGPEAAARLRARYRSLSELDGAGLDALIVTGAEPRCAELSEEPFFASLAALADWAWSAAVPTLWSCLAAHAAVLHLDGVPRRPLAQKCSGVFACAPVGSDPLVEGLDQTWITPHSRGNGLHEPDLVSRGYRILSRSPQAGVDAFVRRGGTAAFLFLQGHPEYDQASLMLEFKRDLQRYLLGARVAPPALPQGVFEPPAHARMAALLDAARSDRSPELMARWPPASQMGLTAETWRAPAARLLRNWLASAQAAERPAPLRRTG